MKPGYAIAINGEIAKMINFSSLLKYKNYSYSYGEKVDLLSLRRKKLDIIIEGEELFIFDLDLSFIKLLNLKVIIDNILQRKFLNRENILFDYKIVKITYKTIKVLIYCINGKNMTILNEELSHKINSIKALQLIYSQVYIRRLKKKSFLLIVRKNEKLYLLIVKNKLLIANRIFSQQDKLWNKKLLEYIDDLNRINFIPSPIYIVEDEESQSGEKINLLELRETYEICLLS